MSIYVVLVTKFECGQIIEKRYVVMKKQEVRKPVLDRSRLANGYEINLRNLESSFDHSVLFMSYMLEKKKNPEFNLIKLFPSQSNSLPPVGSVKHYMSQDKMRDICESIQQNVEPDYDYAVIDFGAEHKIWNGQEFHLFETAIKLRIVGFESEWCFLHDNDKENTTIYIRGGNFDSYGKCKREAFLKVKGADGSESFFEIESLSLLSYLFPASLSEEELNEMDVSKAFLHFVSTFTYYSRQSSFFIDHTALKFGTNDTE